MITLDVCKHLDACDELAAKKDEFCISDGTLYFDGNSLGLSTYATQQAVASASASQWAEDAIVSWNKANWINLPEVVGEKIAPLIGAAPSQTLCCDSISINLFKLICYAKQINPNKRNNQEDGRHLKQWTTT